MWHASTQALSGWPADKQFLRRMAKEALKGVGDANLGEWGVWREETYHLKRRLSAEEQVHVGEACDIRGTPEADTRWAAMADYLPMEILLQWRE